MNPSSASVACGRPWPYGSVLMTCTAPVGKRTHSWVLPTPLSRAKRRSRLALGAAGASAQTVPLAAGNPPAKLPAGAKSFYLRQGEKESFDWPIAEVAVE